MEKKRCGWCEGNALYTKYHDQEWGVPTFNDKILFEFLIFMSAAFIRPGIKEVLRNPISLIKGLIIPTGLLFVRTATN